MESPQRDVTSFLDYNKIHDGGRRPFWKTENRNNSAAITDIATKFFTAVDMDSPQRAVMPYMTCI